MLPRNRPTATRTIEVAGAGAATMQPWPGAEIPISESCAADSSRTAHAVGDGASPTTVEIATARAHESHESRFYLPFVRPEMPHLFPAAP